jgi:glutaminyl-tRNA synthetase
MVTNGQRALRFRLFQQLYDWLLKWLKMERLTLTVIWGYGIKRKPTQPGVDGPYRNRSVQENLTLFEGMKWWFSRRKSRLRRLIWPLYMRPSNLYRVLHRHHRTGNDWKIYPMYDFAHGEWLYWANIALYLYARVCNAQRVI